MRHRSHRWLAVVGLVLGLLCWPVTPSAAGPASAERRVDRHKAGDPEAMVALTLLNGWTSQAGPTARSTRVELSDGIVRFTGVIFATTDASVPFVLPAAMRPSRDVYVPVDVCSAGGQLLIKPDGTVNVLDTDGRPLTSCILELEGVSFVRDAPGMTPLALRNGWFGGPRSTRTPKAVSIGGIAYLRGAIGSGTTSDAFTLPADMRPARRVYVPIVLCDARGGRLRIESDGTVLVEAEFDDFAQAQCSASLDGAHFVLSPRGQGAVTLLNGWTGALFGTRSPKAVLSRGVVHLRGAIAGGTQALAGRLPRGVRPSKRVILEVDMCAVTQGILIIDPTGYLTVESEDEGPFSVAQCLTSLDGASFVV